MSYFGGSALTAFDEAPVPDCVVRIKHGGPLTAVTGSQDLTWLDDTISQISNLFRLPENWDSHGAARMRNAPAVAMIDVLSMLMPEDAISPAIVPSACGHMQAEWHVNGIDLEIEVLDNATIDVSFARGAVAWEKRFSTDLTELVAVVRHLTKS